VPPKAALLSTFGAQVNLFTVPSGERVVITYAAVEVHIPSGEHAVVSVGSSPFGPEAELPLTDAGAFNVATVANEFLNGGGPANIVYSPGGTITVEAFRSQGDGDNIGELWAGLPVTRCRPPDKRARHALVPQVAPVNR
jgi:hypothetical protein